ncbi:hypothetical protein DPMN_093670 [Dreissena polymorpha]|uniref:Uncharacterized protein n=1 Tax=Dreissena polymorpha TaxID=45954 RepID=A0A9D4R2S4_DREPO|nr:hypothetical protein DPMN_093670 [Dreissena polymorpha]
MSSKQEIDELVFKRHELFEADVKPMVSVEALSKRMGGLPNVSNSMYKGPAVGELFKSLRLSYYVCGRTSQDYKQLLERFSSACQKVPQDTPKYNDFEHLPYDLKYDIQQIIPSFQKQL